jgi:hypothetical protein
MSVAGLFRVRGSSGQIGIQVNPATMERPFAAGEPTGLNDG